MIRRALKGHTDSGTRVSEFTRLCLEGRQTATKPVAQITTPRDQARVHHATLVRTCVDRELGGQSGGEKTGDEPIHVAHSRQKESLLLGNERPLMAFIVALNAETLIEQWVFIEAASLCDYTRFDGVASPVGKCNIQLALLPGVVRLICPRTQQNKCAYCAEASD